MPDLGDAQTVILQADIVGLSAFVVASAGAALLLARRRRAANDDRPPRAAFWGAVPLAALLFGLFLGMGLVSWRTEIVDAATVRATADLTLAAALAVLVAFPAMAALRTTVARRDAARRCARRTVEASAVGAMVSWVLTSLLHLVL